MTHMTDWTKSGSFSAGRDPTKAFERLRAEIESSNAAQAATRSELTLLRRAIEGLAAERGAVDAPLLFRDVGAYTAWHGHCGRPHCAHQRRDRPEPGADHDARVVRG